MKQPLVSAFVIVGVLLLALLFGPRLRAQRREFIPPAHPIGMVSEGNRILLAETRTACLFIIQHDDGKTESNAVWGYKKASPEEPCE